MTPPAAAGRGRRRRLGRRLWLAAAALAAACGAAFIVLRPRPAPYTPGTEAAESDAIGRTLVRDLPQDAPRIRFTDAASEAGLAFRHFHGRRSTHLPEDMGSGLAWGDYDGDGDPDLFLVNESGPLDAGPAGPPDSPARGALYRNDGGGRLADVTAASGIEAGGCGMGAAWGDYEGDGDLDLAVTRYGTNLLFRNDGGGRFTDVSRASGVGAHEGFWTGAAWGDPDRDGDLDLYVTGYVRYRFDPVDAGRTTLQYRALVPYSLNPSSYPPERNLLLVNDRGRFVDAARRAGVANPEGRSLSAAWADFDDDGWPDLYVANDISDNAMYRNLGDGRFADISHAAWVADHRGAMGLAIGDWDGDQDLDIFITHWIAQENALYDNQRRGPAPPPDGRARFLDIADQVGLGQIALDYVGWGTGFFDYDNDGREDLFVVDGSTFQREDDPGLLVPMRNLLFWNGGRDRGFFETGAAAGGAFAGENVGRGAAAADYDGDGDLDLAINVNGAPARLLRNDGDGAGGWLRVIVRGAPGPARGGARTTTFAEGARLRAVVGESVQMRVIGAGPSYLSQSPPGEAHFGTGSAARIDRLEIDWPDGRRDRFGPFPVRATVTIREGSEPVVNVATSDAAAPAAAADRTGAPSGATASAGPGPERADVLAFWNAFRQATSSRMRGAHADAARAYEAALAIDPRHEDSLYYLGQSRLELKDPESARRAWSRLVGINGRSARGHLALGALDASPDPARRLDLDAAASRFLEAHRINMEESGPVLRLGEVALVRGDLEGASRWLEAAARSNPKSVEAALLLASLARRGGRPADAAALLRRAERAAAAEAPVRGVLSEGDRRPAAGGPAGGAAAAAPALSAPMGRTLFGDVAARVGREADEALFAAIDQVVLEGRRRAGITTSAALTAPDTAARSRATAPAETSATLPR